MRTASAHAAQRPVHASLVIHNPDSRPTKHKRHEDTHIITPAPQTAWDILKGKWEGLHNPKLWSKVEDEAHTGNATRRAHAPEPYRAATYLSGLAGKARTEKKSTLCIPERERMRRSSFRPVVVRFYCLVLVKLCEQVYLHEEKKKMETTFSALLKPPFFHLFPLIVTVRTLSDYYSKHRCLFVSENFRTFDNPNLSLCNEYAPPDTAAMRRGLFFS